MHAHDVIDTLLLKLHVIFGNVQYLTYIYIYVSSPRKLFEHNNEFLEPLCHLAAELFKCRLVRRRL